jgi:hypothetical protein
MVAPEGSTKSQLWTQNLDPHNMGLFSSFSKDLEQPLNEVTQAFERLLRAMGCSIPDDGDSIVKSSVMNMTMLVARCYGRKRACEKVLHVKKTSKQPDSIRSAKSALHRALKKMETSSTEGALNEVRRCNARVAELKRAKAPAHSAERSTFPGTDVVGDHGGRCGTAAPDMATPDSSIKQQERPRATVEDAEPDRITAWSAEPPRSATLTGLRGSSHQPSRSSAAPRSSTFSSAPADPGYADTSTPARPAEAPKGWRRGFLLSGT